MKTLITDENYVTIQGWMTTKLKLKGNDLLIFAIIYGFCQLEGHKYTGSLQYLADWTNTSKQTCINNLKKLIDKKYIIKEEFVKNGLKFCSYSINLDGIQKFLIPIQKTLINNIDNNIDNIANINISNSEKSESTFDDINKELEDKKKSKKKSDKIRNSTLMKNMLENFTSNTEVLAELKKYFDIRKKRGLTPEQWKIILDDLRKECGTNKEYALEKIKKATAGGWMQIIYKSKSTFSSKPSFDNTANHITPKSTASMTQAERDNFIKNDLAYDENGNLLKF